MASAILHIKDAYYFDVPKSLWRHHYTSLDQVPEFLRNAHPHSTPEEFNEALDGKVLIPQPFATLKNLYEKQPESGFAISKFMILELLVASILAVLFIRLAVKMRTAIVPRGKGWHFLEGILFYIRDEIAMPAIGHHDADRFVPLLWTMFFFILGLNLFGLVPWAGSPTASFSVTLALAAITLGTVLISGSIKFGPVGFWFNQVPHMDLPWYMAPLKLMIWIIEVVGLMIRHGVLAVRLLANMVAGHVVLLAIMGLAFSLAGATSDFWLLTAVISIISSTLLCCLELFVAVLQAYVFTFLSALFIGSAVHRH
ncbi:MAG TPA: F0F1 ATP synthase subunit A [Pirellulales bacterium]|jgi:F-type H+-transporting ATPase subunit a|nr:F0F1 ATP synthase subunit A [Pirellulales bacterium]